MSRSALVSLGLPLALWPVLVFLARGFVEDSEGARGLLPLGLVVLLFLRTRGEHPVDEGGGMRLCAILLGVYLALWFAPLATPAMAVGLMALWWGTLGRLQPPGGRLGILLLLLSALPIARELDFYAGFPLRLVSTRIAALILWPLHPELSVLGSSLVLMGRVIEIDAPCSGLRMLWTGGVTAVGAAAWLRLPPLRLGVLLFAALVVILLANALRAALLALAELRGGGFGSPLHAGVGLIIFLATSVLILLCARRLRIC